MSNIQFDYSTLSTSISRSELGSILGNHIIVDSNYEINEETHSDKSSNTSEIYVHPPPTDKFKLVYLTFGLLGIGVLLPWNFFITANDYWMYKFRYIGNTSSDYHNKTSLQAAFTSYLALSNNIPYVIFLIICTIFNDRLAKISRIVVPLVTLFLLFATVTALIEANTDTWQMGFFAVTILTIIGVGVVSAILQSGVASVVSLLPSKYMQIMVLGQAIAGIIASVAQALSLIAHASSIKSALIYFFCADTVLLLTLLAYCFAQKTEFFRYHVHFLKDAACSLKNVSDIDIKVGVPLTKLLKLLWPYIATIVLDFTVTIGIFPGLAVLAAPEAKERAWNPKLFLPLACFLLFNVSDFGGRAIGGWIPIPHSKRMYLFAFSVLRLLFFPLFMLYNLQPRSHLPVVFTSDACYIAFMTLMGLTNGYCVSVAMVVGIKSVSVNVQETAGVVLTTALAVGLMTGALFSYIAIIIL